MKTPISSPPKPSPPRWIGTAPSVNAIGSVTGAQIRSYGRTHTAAPTPTSRKNTPYGVCAPPSSSWSRPAKANSASVASSQQPRPVSFAAGIRRRRFSGAAGSGRCGRAR
ncbi:hypothetical protein OJ254_04055 [Streptomyces endophytica]|uniref:Uncharacterized protein n=1 Tax=Streptomyces endophytica TaxID=2991496 RepID=A0ABY6P7J9_9ACTN|nr:hypothetical protein [Streptomyces endophytica]UZJ29773.1 hypothetical protein OJ254_04055 [Streptomyces endophytica]